MQALDYNVIASRVMRQAKCSRDDAWTAIGTVYASQRCDTNRSIGEQANWMVKSASYAVLTAKVQHHAEEVRTVNDTVTTDDDSLDLWDTLPTPQDPDNRTDELRRDLLSGCAPQYRLGLAVVLHHIFNARFVCALTQETVRQILKRAGITKAATDQAANIITYLQTYKVAD